jgi:hypothetical protein
MIAEGENDQQHNRGEPDEMETDMIDRRSMDLQAQKAIEIIQTAGAAFEYHLPGCGSLHAQCRSAAICDCPQRMGIQASEVGERRALVSRLCDGRWHGEGSFTRMSRPSRMTEDWARSPHDRN